MPNIKDIEKSIQHAFALKEKGVAVPTILAVFPDEREYIAAAFDFVGTLKKEKGSLTPDAELLSLILSTLSDVPIDNHSASKKGGVDADSKKDGSGSIFKSWFKR